MRRARRVTSVSVLELKILDCFLCVVQSWICVVFVWFTSSPHRNKYYLTTALTRIYWHASHDDDGSARSPKCDRAAGKSEKKKQLKTTCFKTSVITKRRWQSCSRRVFPAYIRYILVDFTWIMATCFKCAITINLFVSYYYFESKVAQPTTSSGSSGKRKHLQKRKKRRCLRHRRCPATSRRWRTCGRAVVSMWMMRISYVHPRNWRCPVWRRQPKIYYILIHCIYIYFSAWMPHCAYNWERDRAQCQRHTNLRLCEDYVLLVGVSLQT